MSFIDLNNLKAREMVPGYKGKIIHSESMTVAYWEVKGGSPLPEHSHPHEQIVNIIKGEIELVVDNTQYRMGPGTVMVIPSGVKHSGRSITDCKIIDIFHPVREDYR